MPPALDISPLTLQKRGAGQKDRAISCQIVPRRTFGSRRGDESSKCIILDQTVARRRVTGVDRSEAGRIGGGTVGCFLKRSREGSNL